MDKIYVVSSSYDGYDSYEISYHKTRKGALKYIIDRNYEAWELCRYIHDDSYDKPHMWITEKELHD